MTYQHQLQTDLPAERRLLSASDVLDFVYRRWRMIFGTALVTLTLTIAALYLVTPSFKSSVDLLMETPQENLLGSDGIGAGLILNTTIVESQLAVVVSKSLLRQVVVSEKLYSDPEFGIAEQSAWLASLRNFLPEFLQEPIDWIASSLNDSKVRDPVVVATSKLLEATQASRIGQSNVMRVTVFTSDARKSAALANKMAETYLADRNVARYNSSRRASEWLNERLKQLQLHAIRSEAAVEKFKVDNNLLATRSGSLSEQQLLELNTALVNARADAAAKRANFGQIEVIVAANGDLTSNAQVLESGSVAALKSRLDEIVSTEVDLRQSYSDKHPEVRRLKSERRVVEAQLGAALDQAVRKLKNELELAEAKQASLQQSLAAASMQSGTDNQAAVQLRELERIAAADRQVYETFLGRSKIAAEEMTLPVTDARVISAAVVPDQPDSPRKKLLSAFGLLLGLCLGAGAAVAREILTDGFVAKRQIQETFDLPVFGSIPRVPMWEAKSQSIFPSIANEGSLHQLPHYTEAIRGLWFSINATFGGNGKVRVIQVTSALPDEGKTRTVISLARAAAAAGQLVLVIDCDLRLASASKAFGRDDAPGLVDLLTMSTDMRSLIYYDDKSGIYVLPAGARALNPPSLLSSERMTELIAHARGSFDLVVIDSPPVAVAADAAAISRVVDSVVFAVKWNSTSRELVSQAIKQLHCPVGTTGIVMTMVDEQKMPRFGRYQSLDRTLAASYDYKGYYGYRHGPEPKA